MEDKLIKDLFDRFDPALSDTDRFMDSLSARLDAIDAVRRDNASALRRMRRTAAVAAIAGFVAGVAFTLALPALQRLLADAGGALLHGESLASFTDLLPLMSWLVVAGATAGTSLGACAIAGTARPFRH